MSACRPVRDRQAVDLACDAGMTSSFMSKRIHASDIRNRYQSNKRECPQAVDYAIRRVCIEISARHSTASVTYGKALVEPMRIGERLF